MEATPRSFDYPFGKMEFHDWYFHVKPLEDSEFDVANISILMEKCIELANGKRFCMLVDANKNVKSSTEGREWAAKAGYNSHIVARAIITNSLAMRMTANFFIRFNKPVVETRLFTSEKEAKEWLRSRFAAVRQ